MSNELLIRIAEDEDVQTLAQFNVTLAWQTEHKRLDLPVVTRGVRTLLKNPHNGFYTVAEAADEVVGCALITYEWSDWRCGLFWWIQSVYVKPEFRRQKVFSRLFDFSCVRRRRQPHRSKHLQSGGYGADNVQSL
ncbi:MAG: GNAT family N-acetyltransferase [Planctomycetota bacterium]